MKITALKIAGAFLLEPEVFGDSRGYFLESFSRRKLPEEIRGIDFLQDNESKSAYGVIRGLHLQKGDAAQSKLVRAIQGEVLDVLIDIRPDSPTYLKKEELLLSGANHRQIFIPRGCLHGFAVLTETAIFAYKVDAYYDPKSEAGVIYSDPKLKIDWQIPEKDRLVSAKDMALPTLDKADLL